MELDEFVREALVQITNGIVQANEQLGDQASANSNFANIVTTRAATGIEIDRNAGTNVLIVKFDVAVTEASSKEGGGKISVMGIGAGGSAGSENTVASRIQFNIPLGIPFK